MAARHLSQSRENSQSHGDEKQRCPDRSSTHRALLTLTERSTVHRETLPRGFSGGALWPAGVFGGRRSAEGRHLAGSSRTSS